MVSDFFLHSQLNGLSSVFALGHENVSVSCIAILAQDYGKELQYADFFISNHV